jgi:hypothetical protein
MYRYNTGEPNQTKKKRMWENQPKMHVSYTNTYIRVRQP